MIEDKNRGKKKKATNQNTIANVSVFIQHPYQGDQTKTKIKILVQ